METVTEEEDTATTATTATTGAAILHPSETGLNKLAATARSIITTGSFDQSDDMILTNLFTAKLK